MDLSPYVAREKQFPVNGFRKRELYSKNIPAAIQSSRSIGSQRDIS